jgi:hypothetical protein
MAAVLLKPSARQRYTSAYPRIQTGDEKQKVISVLGQPDQVSDCTSFWYSQADEETKSKCAEQFWYRGGLEQWLVVFDRDGRVLTKSHNISC